VPPPSDRVTGTILKALNNPRRREALRLLHRSSEPMSAVQMAQTVKDPGSGLSHDLRALEKYGVVNLVTARKKRGATEKLYESTVLGNAKVELILADTEEDDVHVRH
jgi:DNA-binding transcriptional ArsR family regulator